eukprot:3923579-Rhodomonas_salina.1
MRSFPPSCIWITSPLRGDANFWRKKSLPAARTSLCASNSIAPVTSTTSHNTPSALICFILCSIESLCPASKRTVNGGQRRRREQGGIATFAGEMEGVESRQPGSSFLERLSRPFSARRGQHKAVPVCPLSKRSSGVSDIGIDWWLLQGIMGGAEEGGHSPSNHSSLAKRSGRQVVRKRRDSENFHGLARQQDVETSRGG